MNNIKQWWQDLENINGTVMYRFQQPLKAIEAHLKNWNKNEFGNIHSVKRELEHKMT